VCRSFSWGSQEGLSEQQLNDLGLNFLRTQLVTVPGAVVPLTPTAASSAAAREENRTFRY
jgi:hypothetical protein